MTTNIEGYDDTRMRLAVLQAQYDDLVQRMKADEEEAQRLEESKTWNLEY